MKVYYNSRLFKLPLLRQYEAIVLGSRCFIKGSTASARLLSHELIHQEQMDRHGVMVFYGIYLREYVRNLWYYRNHDLAYSNIPFEIEANARERDHLIDSVLIEEDCTILKNENEKQEKS